MKPLHHRGSSAGCDTHHVIKWNLDYDSRTMVRARTLESVAFYYADDSNAHLGFLDRRGESTQVVEPHVSANLFPTLGVHAAIGRTFLEGDGGAAREEDAHALVLSDAVWRGAFGADLHIVGRVVR